ncbi:MAG: Uma2 family endonuclease [Chloroflexi bacterium]|nr:Uma2 family endonuclease [Chloroflexota bacterium]
MATATAIAAEPVARRADEMPGPPQGRWTYDAYAALPDDGNRYEVLDGVLYVSPSPAPRHQRRLGRLFRLLAGYVEDQELGELFIAPLDLVMPGATPVQPDAFLFLQDNPPQLDDANPPVVGVPDLVIEISSPSTVGYDRREKQDVYARAGVHEYWPVDPVARTIEVLVLDAGVYRSRGIVTGASRVPSAILPNLPYTVDELLGPQRA